ncbi:MAG: hypothetical protein AAGC71_18505 [Pseudomonadota bacterium]
MQASFNKTRTLSLKLGLVTAVALLVTTAVAETAPPFQFGNFNQNGWTGALTWADTKSQEVLVVTTHANYMPEGANADNLTLFMLNQTANASHCVAEYVESGRSDDGLTLSLTRAPNNSCPKSIVAAARLRAVTPLSIAVELLAGDNVLASGTITTRRRNFALSMPNPRNEAMVARRQAARSRARSTPRGASSANEQAVDFGSPFPDMDLDEAHRQYRERYERENPQVAGVPNSLHGLFMVTADGLMLEMFDNGQKYVGRIVQPNHFFDAAGLGTESNVIKGSYDGRLGRMYAQRRSVAPVGRQSTTRHCGAIYGFGEVDFLRPAGAGRWLLEPGGDTFCTAPRINVFSCDLSACSKRESTEGRHEGTFFFADRATALATAQQNKANDTNKTALQDQYEALAAERRAERANEEPTPGYFERGGACGNLSCEEEDVNQLILDLYW